jgi:hypothetical protein
VIIDKRQLRLSLIDLSAGDRDLRSVPRGQCLALLLDELLLLARQLRSLKAQFAVVQRSEELTLAHEVARARWRLSDVAVEGRHARPEPNNGILHSAGSAGVAENQYWDL